MGRALPWRVLFVTLALASLPGGAVDIPVSPSTPNGWLVIESAQAGDVVLLAPGVYAYRVYLTQAASAANPIRIRAADFSNPPVFDLAGGFASAFPGSYGAGDRGRGIFQIAAPGYVLDGIVFRNCADDLTECAGVRVKGADDVTLRGCRIQDTQMGVDADGDNLLIEHTEISRVTNMGIQLYAGHATVRYSLIRDSGALNILANVIDLTLEHSWLARAGAHSLQAGNCGRLCGGSGTGSVIANVRLVGNVFIYGAQANTVKTVTLIGGASSDSTGVVRTVNAQIAYNTFVGAAGVAENLIQVVNAPNASTIQVENNAVVDYGSVLLVGSPATLQGTNNWVTAGTDVGALAGSVSGAAPGFTSVATLDFRPTAASPLRLAATPGAVGSSALEYFQDEAVCCQFRARPSALDIGAFESTTVGPGTGPLQVLPGPRLFTVACGCGATGLASLIFPALLLWVGTWRRRVR